MGTSLTGYPSIDKPWLRYYSEDVISAALPTCTVYEYLWEQNKNHLSDIALIYFDKKITYGELFENITAAAKAFCALGIKPGDTVSVCIPNIPEAVYIFYALNRISCVCNLLDPRSSESVMYEHLSLARSKVIITITECYDIFANFKERNIFDNILILNVLETLKPLKRQDKFAFEDIIWQELISSSENMRLPNSIRDIFSPNVILHTGGTTGTPKGVCLCDSNFHSLVTQWGCLNLNYKRKETLLSLMPPFVSFGLTANMHVPLSFGMCLILVPEYDPEKVVELIERYRPNCVPASPAHWEVMYKSPKFNSMDLSFLKFAFIGGDILNSKIEQGLNQIFQKSNCGIKIVKGYGMTETTTAVAMSFSNDINFPGSVGVPLPKTTVGIFDPSGIELPYNSVGEICVQSPSNMLGYYNNKSETMKSIQTHNNEKWLHTGDLGLMTQNGILYIKGRIKRIIIRYDGIKIYPVDIESKLLDCPIISDCAVVQAKDPEHLQGSIPVAIIVLKPRIKHEQNIIKQIEAYCLENIIDYAIPQRFQFVKQLPYTSNGKVDYRTLEQIVSNEK